MNAHPIGRAITSLRERTGYTLTRLAERAGISKGSLSKLESHHNPNPCYNTLVKVAKGLRIGTTTLLRTIAVFEKDR